MVWKVLSPRIENRGGRQKYWIKVKNRKHDARAQQAHSRQDACRDVTLEATCLMSSGHQTICTVPLGIVLNNGEIQR